MRYCIFGLGLSLLSSAAMAGEVTIVAAEAKLQDDGRYQIQVTLRHGDTGWQHYADGWDVRTTDGLLLGQRKLLHPHINEQPFTRALSGVTIPPRTDKVYIHAHDTQHGDTPNRFELPLDNALKHLR